MKEVKLDTFVDDIQKIDTLEEEEILKINLSSRNIRFFKEKTYEVEIPTFTIT